MKIIPWDDPDEMLEDLRLPAIVQASRQLREETLAMYYGNRVFTWRFDSRDVPLGRMIRLTQWLNGLGQAQASMIRKLVIEVACCGRTLEEIVRKAEEEVEGEKEGEAENPRDVFVGDFLRAIGPGRYRIPSIILKHPNTGRSWSERSEGLLNEPFLNSGLPDEVFDGEEEWNRVLFGNDESQVRAAELDF